MSPARPWAKQTPAERVEAVRPLEATGDANSIIAFRLKAPRSEVDRICALLRRERHAADVITNTPRGSSGTAREASSTGSGTTAEAPGVGTQSGSPNIFSDTPPSEKGGGDVPNEGVSAVPPDPLAVNASPKPAAPPQPVTAPGRATSSPPARDHFPPWRDMSARERDDVVMALRAEGLTIDEVGARLGVTRSAISGVVFRMKQRGVAVPGNTDRTRQPEDKAARRSPRSKDEPPTRWQMMNARAKEAEIIRMAGAGMTVAAMMAEMGASEHAIRFVIGRLRKAGVEVVAQPKPKAPPKLLHKTPNGIEARPLRGPNNPHPNDFKARAERRAADPGILIGRASAFDPIPGVDPVPFASPGCKWPVDGRNGPGMLACGAPKTITGAYCQAHAHLAYRPALYRLRAPRGA